MKAIVESVAGSGEITGKIISWCLSPEIGPTTKMFSALVLYGEIYTPLFFFLISSGTWLAGASLKPSGKITTAPTFRPPRDPLPKTCLLVRS